MRILLVEDDPSLSATIKDYLYRDYRIEQSQTLKEAFIKLNMNIYDLVILDIALPDGTGLDICRKIRRKRIQLPIIVISGQETISQKVAALNIGADDYITKPFAIEELKARIHAHLRRATNNPHPEYLKVGHLHLDVQLGIVHRGKMNLKLRKKETTLLEYLMRNKGKICTREQLQKYIWQTDTDQESNTITVHIKHLRDLIDTDFKKKMIRTIHGWGYTIEP